MSMVPRPQIRPSAISPPNGSCCHRDGSVGTTSMWCINRMGLALPVPFKRASTIERPGPDSKRFAGIPSRSKIPMRKSAAFVTSPGGFDVLMRTYD